MSNSIAQLLREAACKADMELDEEAGAYVTSRIQQVLNALEAQEPVAWACSGGSTIRHSTKMVLEKWDAHDRDRANEYNIPLYRHPPTSAVPEGFPKATVAQKGESK